MHDVCVPRDPRLPRLAIALDSAHMSGHFARSVLPTFSPAHPRRYELSGCSIDHVRYRPGRNCAIAYRLRVLDSVTREHHDLRFQGRMFPPDGAASRHAKACEQPLEPPPLGPPLHLITPLDMVLWAFPNERKLSGLGRVLDEASLSSEILPEVIAAGWGADWRLTGCRREVLHYVPEHTLTLRVQATLRHRATGESRPVALFGKCYHDDQAAQTFATMRALTALHESLLRTPAALCHQPAHRLMWQTALPGVALADLLHVPAAAPALLHQAGAQIAALHAAPVRLPTSLTFEGLAARIDAVEPLLAAQPGDARRLASRLAQALRQRRPADAGAPVLLHGDLHAKNLLAGHAGLGLIDLDACTMGPAAWDLGSFVAALVTSGPARDSRTSIESLLAGYGNGAAAIQEELDWCIACALLVERAGRSVSRLKPGRMAALPRLLELAGRVLLRGWREGLA